MQKLQKIKSIYGENAKAIQQQSFNEKNIFIETLKKHLRGYVRGKCNMQEV